MLLPLLSEFGDCCPWLAERLVRWSGLRLGKPEVCARYKEEWLANLAAVPGRLPRLAAALGYLVCVPRMRWSLRGAATSEVRKIRRAYAARRIMKRAVRKLSSLGPLRPPRDN